MSELTITLLRLGLLVLLWAFVLSTIGVLRRDLFGTRLLQRAGAPAPKAAAAPTGRGKPSAHDAGRIPRTLVVSEGSMEGTSIDLTGAEIIIGRSPNCTLVLTDDYSSGRHLRIFSHNDRWFAEDLGSTNGTYIDGNRLTTAQPLVPGTQLRIGRTILELRR